METKRNSRETRKLIEEAKRYSVQKMAIADKNTVIVIANNGRQMRRLAEIFKVFDICYVQIKPNQCCREVLVDLVRCSPDGFDSLLAKYSPLYPVFQEFAEHASFNDAIDFLVKYPRVLCASICFNKGLIVTGTRIEDLSVFFPDVYKNTKRSLYKEQITSIAEEHLDDVYKEGFEDQLVNVDDYVIKD